MNSATDCVTLTLESRLFKRSEDTVSLNSFIHGYISNLERKHGLDPKKSYRLALGLDVLPVNAEFRDTIVQQIFNRQQSGITRELGMPSMVLEEGYPSVKVTFESSEFETFADLLDVSESFGSIRARIALKFQRKRQDTFLCLHRHSEPLDDFLSGRHFNLFADPNPIIRVIFRSMKDSSVC